MSRYIEIAHRSPPLDVSSIFAAAFVREPIRVDPGRAGAHRSSAEARLERLQVQAREGLAASAEYQAKSAAAYINAARLKELRLDKEEADRQAAVLVTPAPRRYPAVRTAKALAAARPR